MSRSAHGQKTGGNVGQPCPAVLNRQTTGVKGLPPYASCVERQSIADIPSPAYPLGNDSP